MLSFGLSMVISRAAMGVFNGVSKTIIASRCLYVDACTTDLLLEAYWQNPPHGSHTSSANSPSSDGILSSSPVSPQDSLHFPPSCSVDDRSEGPSIIPLTTRALLTNSKLRITG
ncbi:hypothetical protein C8R41DRAFT_629469 [Lentinula lateritia]|uniref:Secreted protein n=1 Tax=Lentinula lateritia TaxID=40482 RepID=A0ABQ8V5P8_9AGAR|nr:hypothetical protein C8R41DRAFT_629469 [Lentinula lateritia]